MEIIFQFPIIDRRNIIDDNGVLNVWPNANMSKEELTAFFGKRRFVRSFGEIGSDLVGFYCNINCIKYHPQETYGLPWKNNSRTTVTSCYKKLYSESKYSKKAEFYFSDDLEYLVQRDTEASPVDLLQVLKYYVNGLHVNIQIPLAPQAAKPDNYFIRSTIAAAGRELSRNYHFATIGHNAPETTEALVTPGDGCVVLAFANHERMLLPRNAILIKRNIRNTHINLYGYTWNNEGQTFKVWLLELPAPSEMLTTTQRQVLLEKRMYLLHTNAEKEATRVLLQNYTTAPATESSKEPIKKYLSQNTKKLLRPKRFGANQKDLVDCVLQGTLSSKPKEDTGDDKQRAISELEENMDEMQRTLSKLKDITDDDTLQAIAKKLLAKFYSQIPKKKVLFISSNPAGKPRINFGDAVNAIKDGLTKGDNSHYYEVMDQLSVTKDKLDGFFIDNVPDYLHIFLHNEPVKGLYFQDASGGPAAMSVEQFAAYIKLLVLARNEKGKKKPEAIVLCACNSMDHAKAVKDLCDYAMGTNDVFPEDAAIAYSRKFYEALFGGHSIPFCHRDGKLGIIAHKDPWMGVNGHNVADMPELLPPPAT